MNPKKIIITLLAVSCLSFICVIFANNAASFNKYAPKLLRFEGAGYGIHKPIWGNKMFTKDEALYIHKHYYWNRFLGHRFKNQNVAEVFIDHLINAGEGKDRCNVKAFEEIIGAEQDGILSVADVNLANAIEYPEQIVNPYVQYRLRYYKGLKNAHKNRGWFRRAESFYMEEKPQEPKELEENVIEDYIVLPKTN